MLHHATSRRAPIGSFLHGSDRPRHEHAINGQELLAHLTGDVVVINRRLGVNAECRQLLEYAVKAIVLGSCGSHRLAIAAPKSRVIIVYVGGEEFDIAPAGLVAGGVER